MQRVPRTLMSGPRESYDRVKGLASRRRAARTMRTETRFGIKARILVRRQRLRIGGDLAWLVKPEEDHSAHSGLRQAQPNRRRVLFAPTLPSTPNATVTPTPRGSLSNSDAPTPFPEAASQPRAQDSIAPANRRATPVLSERSRPQHPARSARRRPRRGSCELRNSQYVEACRRRKEVEMLFAHSPDALAPNGSKRSQRGISTRLLPQNLRRLARFKADQYTSAAA